MIKCIMCLLVTLSLGLQAQQLSPGFTAEILLGANFSQLDGDRLTGFEKFGPRVGTRISWPVSDTWSASTSILYEGRGSASQLVGGGVTRSYIDLRYISLPISVHHHSWWDEEISRYKIQLIGSVVPARLFATSSTHANFDQALDRFSRWDVSLRAEILYALGMRTGLTLGLERSLLRIYRPTGGHFSALQSYQAGLSFVYQLR